MRRKVQQWLHATGYPLELRVARQLRAAGWHVNYSRWYRDVATGKDRALDLQALTGAVRRAEAHVFYSLCIECKHADSHPWVGLHSGSTVGPSPVGEVASGRLTRQVLAAARQEKQPFPSLIDPSLPLVGGLVRAFADKPGTEDGSPVSPFAALRQAQSAALALDASHLSLSFDARQEFFAASVFLPVVVFDGSLFTYSLDADGSDHLTPVDAVVATIPGDADGGDLLVPVITPNYAETRLPELMERAHAFCVAMLPHASTIIHAMTIGPMLDSPEQEDAAT